MESLLTMSFTAELLESRLSLAICALYLRVIYADAELVAVLNNTHQAAHFAVTLVKKGLAFVCDMTPDQTDEYRRLGKPSPFLFESACAALKIPPESAVMIGDNTETDMEGARRMGMPGILVSPGSKLSFAQLLKTQARTPAEEGDVVLEDTSRKFVRPSSRFHSVGRRN